MNLPFARPLLYVIGSAGRYHLQAASCVEKAGDFRFADFASPDNEAFSSFQFEESGNSLSIYLLLPVLARPMSRGYGPGETTSLFWSRPFDYGKDCTQDFDDVIHTSLRACTISSPDKN